MQADYFLNKRGQFKKSNELYDDLTKLFDDELQFPDGHPLKTKARDEKKTDFMFDKTHPEIDYKYHVQGIDK